jgi:hypothetical protein
MLRRVFMKKRLFCNCNPLIKMVSLTAISLGILFTAFLGAAQAVTDHSELITSYEGSATCKACHPDAVEEVLESIHYKLMGQVQGVYNMFTNQPVEGIHGKGNRY